MSGNTALDIMHRAGWVHHDISSGNVLIDANGHARLADMEYARPLNSHLRETRIVRLV